MTGKTLRFLMGFMLAMSGLAGYGQTISVAGQIVDSDAIAWANGTCTVTYQNSTSGTPYIQTTGVNINQAPACTMDGSGNLSVAVADTGLVLPTGSRWLFKVCPNVSGINCRDTNTAVTAANLSTIIPLINSRIRAPRISGGPGTYAYADVEVAATVNNSYYNVTTAAQRCYTTSWAACGGGGGAPTGAAGGSLAGTYPNPTFSTSSPLAQRVATGLNVVFDGDSLTAGAGTVSSPNRWPDILATYPEWTGRTITFTNNAVAGQTCLQRQAAYPTGGHLLSPSVTGTPGMYFFWAGTNDIANSESAATIYGCLSGLWSTLKTDGWIVVASTVIAAGTAEPSSVINMAVRQSVNDSVRSAGVTSTTYDYLLDPDKIYTDPHNQVWMQSDFIHPNTAGNRYYAAYVNGLIWSHGVVSGVAGPWTYDGLGTGTGNYRTTQLCMFSLTNGANNFCSGINALGTQAGGSQDTAVGNQAGAAVTSGSNDTFVGYGAGVTVTGGSRITAIGEGALPSLSPNNGADMTVMGYNTASSCTTCSASGAFGSGANLGAAVTGAYQIGSGQNVTSSSLQFLTWNFLTSTGNSTFNTTTSAAYATTANCAAVGTSASPSLVACAAASAGAFSCATTASAATCIISDTAVTANSQIFVQEVADEGTRLGVTCNTTPSSIPVIILAAKVAATSFTVNVPTITTNPACYDFWITN